MKLLKFTIFVLLSLMLLNCKNDDDNNQPSSLQDATSISLITGLNIRMSDTSASIRLGNPNTLTNGFLFVAYPNPTPEFITIRSLNTISDVWFVPAIGQRIYQSEDFSDILDSDLYSEETIASGSELQLNDLDTNEILINIENLSQGYYKLFIKIDDSIFWDNMYVEGDNFDITEFINFWNE